MKPFHADFSYPAGGAGLLAGASLVAAAGLEARIIKVASAGLDEDFLWTPVTSAEGVDRIKRALRKFGASTGATLGEGGEFETLVVDGPRQLFRRRIDVASGSRKVIREGGGTSWLMLRGVGLADKEGEETSDGVVRTPDLLDARFRTILSELSSSQPADENLEGTHSVVSSSILGKTPSWLRDRPVLLHWAITGDDTSSGDSIEAETSSLVAKVRHLLADSSLEPHHILNTVIILRRMSDFPKINSVYGKLFTRPNPPSRVTISCGGLLPHGRSISIALTVDPSVQPAKTRQGLHVQSRSYWAPANIGPYSQAIGAPAVPEAGTTGLQTWSIAGQIPLIPGTMVLPPLSDSSLQRQIVLSLQHLWRIALDMRIQFWTSAVAFFARSQSGESMKHKADLAWHAWRLAHKQPDEEDEENDGPDPWDLKYNPAYTALGSIDAQESGGGSLPDWSVLTLRQQNEAESCIPPFFAVEVEELPRGSEVEWHAHQGLSQVDESSVEMIRHVNVGNTGWTAWHTIARTGDTPLLHTLLALDLDVAEAQKTDPNLSDINAVRLESVRRLNIAVETQVADSPYLAYANALDTSYRDGEALRLSTVIPCRSIHSSMGRRWAVICLYRTLARI
jgi:enamine deaminase RidA (YjgF/YER057c/UK114 family)